MMRPIGVTQPAMSSTTVSAIATAQSAVESALAALAAKDVSALRSAVYSLAAEIGEKPARSDYAEKDEYKSALDRYFDAKSALARVIRAASESGIALRHTYGASVTKTGAVSFRHAESFTVRPSFAAVRV